MTRITLKQNVFTEIEVYIQLELGIIVVFVIYRCESSLYFLLCCFLLLTFHGNCGAVIILFVLSSYL